MPILLHLAVMAVITAMVQTSMVVVVMMKTVISLLTLYRQGMVLHLHQVQTITMEVMTMRTLMRMVLECLLLLEMPMAMTVEMTVEMMRIQGVTMTVAIPMGVAEAVTLEVTRVVVLLQGMEVEGMEVEGMEVDTLPVRIMEVVSMMMMM
jgi:hypothetical protein